MLLYPLTFFINSPPLINFTFLGFVYFLKIPCLSLKYHALSEMSTREFTFRFQTAAAYFAALQRRSCVAYYKTSKKTETKYCIDSSSIPIEIRNENNTKFVYMIVINFYQISVNIKLIKYLLNYDIKTTFPHVFRLLI